MANRLVITSIVLGTDRKFGEIHSEEGSPCFQGEPVFVIRGRDKLGLAAIARYRSMAEEAEVDADVLAGIDEVIVEFGKFMQVNTDQMHLPNG